MLRKLIKHEIRATGKIIGTIALGMIVLSMLAAIFPVLALHFNSLSDNYLKEALNFVNNLLFTICLAGVLSAIIITFIILARRFYKNMYGNEGYLTFTLPVTSNQLILSKLITSMLSIFFVFLAGILCFIIFITEMCLILSPSSIGYTLKYHMISNNIVFAYFDSGLLNALYCVEKILVIILYIIMILLAAYLAITIGSTGSSNNRKILGTLLFIGENIVTLIGFLLVNVLRAKMYSNHLNWISAATSEQRMAEMDARYQSIIHLESGLQILLLVIVIVVSYLLLKRHLNKKLNLQ